MLQIEIEQLLHWLQDHENKLKYGEVSISLIRHDGRTVRIEKTLTERYQPQEMQGVYHG